MERPARTADASRRRTIFRCTRATRVDPRASMLQLPVPDTRCEGAWGRRVRAICSSEGPGSAGVGRRHVPHPLRRQRHAGVACPLIRAASAISSADAASVPAWSSNCVAARGRAEQGGAEHRGERTPRCVSEGSEARTQRCAGMARRLSHRDVPSARFLRLGLGRRAPAIERRRP
jgi:hypothetical protein